MKIAFTLCSNNYLAQAKTLGDTLLAKNPEYKFYIGLVDRLSPEIDYDKDIKHEIVLIEDIGIPNFDDLWKKYDIIELNTCVKPMFFKYLFYKYPNANMVFYFDPDIMVFNSLRELETEFNDTSAILLTPHIVTPIPIDGKYPFENLFLNYGIYNLGFLGLRKDSVSNSLLNWWEERTLNFGFSKVETGFFVDQLWFNLVPLFFEKVKILRNLGYNIGPWNLHERSLSHNNDNEYFINNNYALTFFHFSNYKYTMPNLIAAYYDRFQLSDSISLKRLYDQYHQLILKNNIEKHSALVCYYVDSYKKYKNELIVQKENLRLKELNKSKKYRIKQAVKKIIPSVLIRIYRAI